MVRESVRYHQGDRFFASCYIAASLFSHKVFLRPLRKGTADPIDKGLPFLRGVKKYKEYFIRAGEMEFTR